MINQIVNLVIRIYFNVFPNFEEFFVYNNIADYTYFVKHTFLLKKINLNIY